LEKLVDEEEEVGGEGVEGYHALLHFLEKSAQK
jgi:hypothetical protein